MTPTIRFEFPDHALCHVVRWDVVPAVGDRVRVGDQLCWVAERHFVLDDTDLNRIPQIIALILRPNRTAG